MGNATFWSVESPGDKPTLRTPSPRDGRLLITPEEAARRLSIGRTALYGLLATGCLESVRVGRSRRIRVAALEAFVEELGGEHDCGERDRKPITGDGYDPSIAEATPDRSVSIGPPVGAIASILPACTDQPAARARDEGEK